MNAIKTHKRDDCGFVVMDPHATSDTRKPGVYHANIDGKVVTTYVFDGNVHVVRFLEIWSESPATARKYAQDMIKGKASGPADDATP